MNRKQIAAAAIVVFVLPQILLLPFRSQLQQIVPPVSVWQSVGMLLGLVVIFVLGIGYWNLRARNRHLRNERERVNIHRGMADE
jgi:chromate transport protein ChrA